MLIEGKSIKVAFEHLAKACNARIGAAPEVCSAVANIIAGAGEFGGSGQTILMDMASDAGFTCEFYTAGVIRVSWPIGKD